MYIKHLPHDSCIHLLSGNDLFVDLFVVTGNFVINTVFWTVENH